MLVQASDGKFYKDPVFYAHKAVVNCEGPMCRVMVQTDGQAHAARSIVRRGLSELGVIGKVLEGEQSKYLFDGNWKPCWDFDLVLKAVTPVPEHAYCVLEPAKDEICYGSWSDFWEHELVDHVHGQLVLSLLVRALVGEWDGSASLVKRRLFKQCPDLRFSKTGKALKRRVQWNNS